MAECCGRLVGANPWTWVYLPARVDIRLRY